MRHPRADHLPGLGWSSRSRTTNGSVVRSAPLLTTLPYVAIILGVHTLHSAWIAVLIYHIGILAVMGVKNGMSGLRDVLSGWSTRAGLAVCLTCAACGPVLILLGSAVVSQPGTLAGRLDGLGLSGRSWWVFAFYYTAIHPILEEVYWRGCLFSARRGLSYADVAFAGYHLLVLPLFIGLHWALGCFAVLALVAWLWRAVARRYEGLAIPAASHAIASLSTIVAVLFLGLG